MVVRMSSKPVVTKAKGRKECCASLKRKALLPKLNRN
jgi:hypothetical protein